MQRLQLGGKGTWALALASPERFAVMIPIGFLPIGFLPDLSGIDGMVKLPLWAMVGMKDSKPHVESILAMEKSFIELGATVVKTTYFEGANHGSVLREIKKSEWRGRLTFLNMLPSKLSSELTFVGVNFRRSFLRTMVLADGRRSLPGFHLLDRHSWNCEVRLLFPGVWL